ncbi:MAG: hypothetical protein ACLP4R_07275 [Solirubrobacteraceae bacterium]
MPEGLSAAEVGKEIAEHHEHTDHEDDHGASEPSRHDRLVTIAEAVLLSVVALLAAWSGYSAAKWGTESSLSLAKASSARSKASLAEIQATQIRTLDSVSFNAAETAYLSHDAKLFALSLRRMRPGYLPAVRAWLALHPLTNPKAPPDPSYMPQYVIPQDAQARTYNAQANAAFTDGEVSAGTADKYVRLTVFLAAVLFLVGIGSRFPLPAARYGLAGVAGVLLVIAVVQLLALPGPP